MAVRSPYTRSGEKTRCEQIQWPRLFPTATSDTGSATAGGAATALVVATSRRLASTSCFELGVGTVVVALRGIHANAGWSGLFTRSHVLHDCALKRMANQSSRSSFG